MKAMVLESLGEVKPPQAPLQLIQHSEPTPGEGEVLLQVTRCGVCHTELDEIEGRTPPPHLPVVLGHQVVGVVEGVQSLPTLESRDEAQRLEKLESAIKVGQRVGVAWIASACGQCQYCLSGQENLCPYFQATGRDINGGYAEYMKVRADFVHPIPDSLSDSEAAPLLCAGAVGYRALKLCNLSNGKNLGLTGFG